jgi:hypothetical protein
MTDIKLNPLNTNQRRLLQLGAALLLVVFLTIFFVVSRKSQNITVKNNTVYLQDAKLYLFDEVIPINQYPDRIVFHYPYLVVVKPELQKSLVYNLATKVKESEIKQIVLDYFKGDSLYNVGNSTFFNKQDLNVLCEKGFIKSSSEILCITKINKNNVENKLVSIDVDTKKSKDIYTSKELLTDVSVINSNTYLGKIDLYTNKSSMVVNKDSFEVPDVVSLIYEMKAKAYFASYKSAFNGQKESYYLMEKNQTIKQENGKILLY